MTNYERIKSMTIEEITELIARSDFSCDYCVVKSGMNCGNISCDDGVRAYLESEVEE